MNISNVAALVDTEGKPHFKYVVEGANLFLTQQARLFLEKRKVVLFKDSSANKGQFSPLARTSGFNLLPQVVLRVHRSKSLLVLRCQLRSISIS